jgi:hypothetical protein
MSLFPAWLRRLAVNMHFIYFFALFSSFNIPLFVEFCKGNPAQSWQPNDYAGRPPCTPAFFVKKVLGSPFFSQTVVQ